MKAACGKLNFVRQTASSGTASHFPARKATLANLESRLKFKRSHKEARRSGRHFVENQNQKGDKTMKQNQTKTAAPAVRARAGLEKLVREIAELKLREVALASKQDAEIQQARERYGPELARLEDAIDRKLAEARRFAETHRVIFNGRRSIELASGVAGWRLGQPALRLAAGGTWETAVAALKELPQLARYVRVREDVNRQALLADRQEIDAALLERAGLRVEQGEIFFVEPKLDSI